MDAVGAPHHPQCRCWQVLVPSRRPTPLCTSTLFHGPFTHPAFPFHPASGVCSPPSSCIHRLPTSTSSSPSSSFPRPPSPNPPAKGLLSPRSLRLVILVNRFFDPRLLVAFGSRNSPSQFPPAPRFATSTISPRKPAAIRTSSAPTQPIPPTVDERKKGPPLPCQISATVRLSLFDSFVFGLP